MTSEQTSTPPTRRTGGSNGLAIASLVTGVAGILFALLFAIVGLALGVVAVGLGVAARRNRGASGQATAGLVTGVVAIVVAVVNMVVAYNLVT
ncbi:MAG: DUF4190 domain-containing protein [Actinomycetota bacterium]|nr:DUF4190 domain-containing protein [Actinomycetota bacterium]